MTHDEGGSDGGAAGAREPMAPPLDWLRSEIAAWGREGLLRSDQAQMILARYGLAGAETPGSLKHQRIVQVVAVLGALLIGAGAVLVVGANWEAIPRPGRLLILMAVTAAFYATGYYLAFEPRAYPAIGRGLILTASLIWGASIFLIAQTFHAGAEGGESTAVLIWFVGVLPLAYILISPEHAILSAALVMVWFFMRISSREMWYEDANAYWLLAMGFGALLYAVGLLHRVRASLAPIAGSYTLVGMGCLLVSAYALTFTFKEDFGWYGRAAAVSTEAWLWAGLVVAPAIVAGVAAWLMARPEDMPARWEAGSVAVLAMLSVAGLVVTSYVLPGSRESAGVAAAVFCNVLLLVMEVGLVALGWARARPGLVNLGLTAFSVHLMTRYFDVIGRMLSGGLAFIGAGVVLLAIGILLEKQRRRLLQSMAERSPT